MAVIDPLHDAVVIRVVYDGPPVAGKTTSVKTLAQALGKQVVVPDEVAGRTLFFDWLDYTGGMFEGRRIRCQIVSVPGQAILASRRQHLLDQADVVVFVADSSPDQQAAVAAHLHGLRDFLAGMEGPPVGIVLQANKRDQPGAVSPDALRAMLDGIGGGIAMVESVALSGVGIREAFVLAVRLALDRVRELTRTGQLKVARPEVDSAQDLLKEMQGLDEVAQTAEEADPEPALISQMLEHAMAEDVMEPDHMLAEAMQGPLSDSTVPLLPSGDLPSGMIWPPVHGRVILHAALTGDMPLARNAHGDWFGEADAAWRLHSPFGARFSSKQRGHDALILWARMHATCAQVISGDRCVVLSRDGTGHYRLWQIVRIQRSLHDELGRALSADGDAVVRELLLTTRAFLLAAKQFSSASCALPLGLREVGVMPAGVCYVGLMPSPLAGQGALIRLTPEAALRQLSAELVSMEAAFHACRAASLAELDKMGTVRNSVSQDLIYQFVRGLFEKPGLE